MYSTGRLGTSASGLSGIIQSSSSYVKPARVPWAEKKAPDELNHYRIPPIIKPYEQKQVDYTAEDLRGQEAVENQITKNEEETPAKKARRTVTQRAKQSKTKKGATTKKATTRKTTNGKKQTKAQQQRKRS